MPFELFIAVATFGFVTSITPGPNNTYLLAAGANHGAKRSLVFVNGIMFGLTTMLVANGLGLGLLFHTVPVLYQAVKYLGFAYILYLAYKVIRSGYKSGPDEVDRPKFFKAILMQFVNAKAWVVTMSFMASYVPVEAGIGITAACILVFLVFTYPGAVAWAVLGQGISKILTDRKRLIAFNWTAGVLLVISMIPALFI